MPTPTVPRSLEDRRRISALGGRARAQKLSPARRREIAQAGHKAMLASRAARGLPPPSPPHPAPPADAQLLPSELDGTAA